jgi:O-antigen/teichoic acid export membrane protein
VSAGPDSLVPIIVLAFLGGEATAFYYAAWTVSFSLRLLTVNLGSAVTVESAHTGRHLHRSSQVRWLAVLVIVPAVIAGWLLAPFVMSIYGPEYQTAATDVLRLLIVSVLPFTVVTLFVVGERIAERTSRALLVVGIATVTTIGLDVLLLPEFGLVGGGWAWLTGQVLAFGATMVLGRWTPVRSGAVPRTVDDSEEVESSPA